MYKHKEIIASWHYGKSCFLIKCAFIFCRAGFRDKSFSFLTIQMGPLLWPKIKNKNKGKWERDEFEKIHLEFFFVTILFQLLYPSLHGFLCYEYLYMSKYFLLWVHQPLKIGPSIIQYNLILTFYIINTLFSNKIYIFRYQGKYIIHKRERRT